MNIDLSASAVDTRGLGLGGATGMQAVAGGADIGDNSPDHTVAQIVNDTSNTSATPGYTDFYISGPGFSDGSEMKVSVNLQGVTTLDGLVASVNSAIQVAASGTSPAAAAFQKAGIVASSYYGQALQFTSSDTPFQVEAGDVMANALMGKLTGTAGTPLATTVTGVGTALPDAAFAAPSSVTVRVTGGSLAAPVDISLDSNYADTTLAIADLAAKVNSNAQLQAAGISVNGAAPGPLTFTDARGETFSVEAAGDTANALGLGSFVAGAGGAVDYTSIQGTAYDPALASGTAHLEFSIDGGASIAIPDIDLSGGDAAGLNSRSGDDLQKTLNDAFASNPQLQAAGLVAKFDGTSLTISSSNNTYFRLNPGTSTASADIGFGTGGAAFTSSLTVPKALNTSIDSTGGTTVYAFSFAGLSDGTGSQTITVSAPDPTGTPQTATITLQNNAQGREWPQHRRNHRGHQCAAPAERHHPATNHGRKRECGRRGQNRFSEQPAFVQCGRERFVRRQWSEWRRRDFRSLLRDGSPGQRIGGHQGLSPAGADRDHRRRQCARSRPGRGGQGREPVELCHQSVPVRSDQFLVGRIADPRYRCGRRRFQSHQGADTGAGLRSRHGAGQLRCPERSCVVEGLASGA